VKFAAQRGAGSQPKELNVFFGPAAEGAGRPICDQRPHVFHRPPSFPHRCVCQHRSFDLCRYADPCWSFYESPLLYAILVKLNPNPRACSPFDAALALDVVTRYREDDALRNVERNRKFETCACFRKVAHGAAENGTAI